MLTNVGVQNTGLVIPMVATLWVLTCHVMLWLTEKYAFLALSFSIGTGKWHLLQDTWK
jgi:hypothetical protein